VTPPGSGREQGAACYREVTPSGARRQPAQVSKVGVLGHNRVSILPGPLPQGGVRCLIQAKQEGVDESTWRSARRFTRRATSCNQ